MQRVAQGGRSTSGPSHGAKHLRSMSLAAVLVLALLAICSYPRPMAPVPPRTGRQPQPLSLELNIPAFRLDVRDSLAVIKSYAVAVGMRRYKTPTGDFEIARIIWNPWWYPPDAEWAALDTITPPGPRNPMGKVKLMFNGPYYLHGTPTVSSLGHATSHGCVRMRNEDAVELALLVQRRGGLALSPAVIDTLTRTWHKTRDFRLANLIPVTIVYRSAEVRESVLTLFPDVYRRHRRGLYPEAMAALAEASVDTMAVDRELVRRLSRNATSKTTSVPIEQLTAVVVEGGLRQ
jgi:hypothetical protein